MINIFKSKNKIVPMEKNEIEFNMLPDTPISVDKQDDLFFGYQQIASTLAKISERAPAPFCIGLFGKWGTGKSTILNQVKNYLSDQSILVIFDIWKYESDALRRSFILDIADQLREYKITDDACIEKIKEKLYLNITKPRESFHFSLKGVLVFLLVFGVIFLSQLAFIKPFSLTTIFSSFLAGLIASLPELFKSTLSVEKISIGQDKVNSPEEFSLEFQTILDKLGDQKLIICIDNLDRVDRDKAVELLGTVKTFLASDRCCDNIIFIISCDDQSLREYLKSAYTGDVSGVEFDADEFLRKFFNTTLRIPKFLNLELDTYTRSLLSLSGINIFKNSLDLELIITHTFRDNPREIKQFINNLTSYYVLANERVESSDLDKNFITQNIAFIAKLLIIRQKYLCAFNLLEQNCLREATSWNEFIENIDYFSEKLSKEEKTDLREFVVNTGWIKPSTDNLAIFFTLRRSEEEKSLPGWDQFLDAAINKRVETAVKIIKRFKS